MEYMEKTFGVRPSYRGRTKKYENYMRDFMQLPQQVAVAEWKKKQIQVQLRIVVTFHKFGYKLPKYLQEVYISYYEDNLRKGQLKSDYQEGILQAMQNFQKEIDQKDKLLKAKELQKSKTEDNVSSKAVKSIKKKETPPQQVKKQQRVQQGSNQLTQGSDSDQDSEFSRLLKRKNS